MKFPIMLRRTHLDEHSTARAAFTQILNYLEEENVQFPLHILVQIDEVAAILNNMSIWEWKKLRHEEAVALLLRKGALGKHSIDTGSSK